MRPVSNTLTMATAVAVWMLFMTSRLNTQYAQLGRRRGQPGSRGPVDVTRPPRVNGLFRKFRRPARLVQWAPGGRPGTHHTLRARTNLLPASRPRAQRPLGLGDGACVGSG